MALFNLSSYPLRKEAKHSAEMVSEILFGEHFKIIERQKDWLKIKLTHDGYEGWIESKGAFPDSDNALTWSVSERCEVKGPAGNFTLYPGSRLPEVSENSFQLGNAQYKILLGSTRKAKMRFALDDLIKTSRQFQNTPYYWGGRTTRGIDCSGFVQIVHAIYGVSLPRDAYQQAEIGTTIPVGEAEAGDIAFFKNDSGNITHVGILVATTHIIHASEMVRVDSFGETGIFRADIQAYTHALSHIKRIH